MTESAQNVAHIVLVLVLALALALALVLVSMSLRKTPKANSCRS